MDAADQPRRTAATPLLVLFFVATRLLLFTNFQLGSEIVRAYSKPALEIEQAARQGVSFYDYHTRRIQKRIDRGEPLVTEEMKRVEYPPLSIVAMYLPRMFVGDAAEEELDHPESVTARYVLAYRVEMSVVDVLIFALLAQVIPRIFPEEGTTAHQERLVVYVLAGTVLGHLLYDRLDLVLGGLVLAALTLLISRAHYFGSFIVLAVAVNFKVIPVVLYPVWVLLSLRPASWTSLARFIAACAGRSLVLIGLTAAVMAPFLLIYGVRCLDFLSFHRQRGLQVESLPSSLLLALAALGYPVRLDWGHGAYELTAPSAALLGRLSTVALAVLLLAGSGLLTLRLRRLVQPDAPKLAEADPAAALGYTLLFLMMALCASKVFSPQFLLVLLPLVPLVPLSGRARRWFQGGFVAVAVLTTVIFPYLYLRIRFLYPMDEYPIPPITGSLAVVSGCLVAARNGLFLALTVLLLWTLRCGVAKPERVGYNAANEPRP